GAAYAGARRPTGAPTQAIGRTAAIPPHMYGPDGGGPGFPPHQQRRASPGVVPVVVIVMLIAATLLIKFIHRGRHRVPVPSVAGTTEKVAQQAIVQAHLTVGPIKHQPSNTVPPGRVISTSPSAGSTEPKGTSITIIESSGPSVHLKSVPPVTNMKRAEAV